MFQTDDPTDLLDQVEIRVLILDVFLQDIQEGVHVLVLYEAGVLRERCPQNCHNGSFLLHIALVSLVVYKLVPHVGVHMWFYYDNAFGEGFAYYDL